MEKYNKLLRNITELIEKGLFTSKDLKKEVEDSLKFKMEIIANKLNLVFLLDQNCIYFFLFFELF